MARAAGIAGKAKAGVPAGFRCWERGGAVRDGSAKLFRIEILRDRRTDGEGFPCLQELPPSGTFGGGSPPAPPTFPSNPSSSQPRCPPREGDATQLPGEQRGTREQWWGGWRGGSIPLQPQVRPCRQARGPRGGERTKRHKGAADTARARFQRNKTSAGSGPAPQVAGLVHPPPSPNPTSNPPSLQHVSSPPPSYTPPPFPGSFAGSGWRGVKVARPGSGATARRTHVIRYRRMCAQLCLCVGRGAGRAAALCPPPSLSHPPPLLLLSPINHPSKE